MQAYTSTRKRRLIRLDSYLPEIPLVTDELFCSSARLYCWLVFRDLEPQNVTHPTNTYVIHSSLRFPVFVFLCVLQLPIRTIHHYYLHVASCLSCTLTPRPTYMISHETTTNCILCIVR